MLVTAKSVEGDISRFICGCRWVISLERFLGVSFNFVLFLGIFISMVRSRFLAVLLRFGIIS